ncbi:hypothetical protein PVT71_24830 (plasmid) [Salipiger sp. H15]|uniref:Uncharacterized protein n=1 Tax=Alloyangia sp. H15 TaxID=3029062 RepID=A0AAU8AQR7_9RHOB
MALAVGTCAYAEGFETRVMQAMIRDIEFITQNSSLEYAGQDLPGVTVVSADALQQLFRSSETHVSAKQDDNSPARVSALYDRFANRIFLDDMNAVAGPAMLHELVHYLQAINDKEDMFVSHIVCLEAEAYDVQAIWQTENEIDLASRPQYGFVTTLFGICNDADFSWMDGAYGR